MQTFLLGFLLHPWFWITIVGLALAAGAMIYLKQTALLIKIVTNPHLWLAAVAVVFYLNISHMQEENQKLKDEVTQLQNQSTADTDAAKTDKNRAAQKTKRADQSTRIQDSIDHAPPGQAQDAVLDTIAQDRPDLNSSSSAEPDVVRKRPDGVVIP